MHELHGGRACGVLQESSENEYAVYVRCDYAAYHDCIRGRPGKGVSFSLLRGPH